MVYAKNQHAAISHGTEAELLERIDVLQSELLGLKKTVRELRQSESKWRNLVHHFPDFIAVVDRALKIEYLNRAVPGLDARKMIGTCLCDYVLPEFHQVLKEYNDRVLQTGATVQFETRGIGPNSATAWYSSRLGPVKVDGEIVSVVHIVTDVTQRKQAEDAARASQQRFEGLFENAPVCILEVDVTTAPPLILAANRRAQMMYGWTANETICQSLEEIFADPARGDLKKILKRIQAGEPFSTETHHVRCDGTHFPVRVSVAPEMGFDPTHIIVAAEEISAELQRRSELEALDKERRRIAHDIHDGLAQSLAALRLKASLWHDLVDTDPAQMHRELENLRSVLKNNIADVRRSIFALRPIALEDLGFFAALRQFLSEFDDLFHIRTELNVMGAEDSLPSTLELPLFRILQESLNNIGLHAQATVARIELDLSRKDSITLGVCDDGIGIVPAALERTDQEGHFGIRHMRERVESYHGTILIQGQPGGGTEVRVMLPLHAR